ncbi:hypothetical protein N657DRAFT_633260 [Parathielavia appendiculata]|uniref:Uncharacterized protein n=1 Tax=Parathielavia appendiculata TaxID=2587402 RepID=A0AAN6U0U7_9PEZI|nr:hypothetical protein N657DRAFT_633260 [Parathielavia appendiculata]
MSQSNTSRDDLGKWIDETERHSSGQLSRTCACKGTSFCRMHYSCQIITASTLELYCGPCEGSCGKPTDASDFARGVGSSSKACTCKSSESSSSWRLQRDLLLFPGGRQVIHQSLLLLWTVYVPGCKLLSRARIPDSRGTLFAMFACNLKLGREVKAQEIFGNAVYDLTDGGGCVEGQDWDR